MAEDKLPHLMFYGPPGTGKTSTILALAREVHGKNMKNMTLELNASDDRGIAVVRQEIQDFASTKLMVRATTAPLSPFPPSLFSPFPTTTPHHLGRPDAPRRLSYRLQFNAGALKLVVLDECDAMTKDAQFALRRIIEKYTKSTRFCLICNYASKIIPALQSRCTRFRFQVCLLTHHLCMYVRVRFGFVPDPLPDPLTPMSCPIFSLLFSEPLFLSLSPTNRTT